MSDLHAIPTAPSPERRTHSRRREDATNEQLARLLLHLPDGVLCINHQWQITFANPEACRSTGLDPSQLNGPTLWEIFPRLHGTRVEQAYHQVMQTGTPARLEYLSAYGDVWRDIQILPSPEGLAVIFRDITDRKGAELLRDSASRRLLQVLEATTDGVVSIDRERRFTFLNRTARNLLNLHGDLNSRDLWRELPFSSERFRSACDRVLQGAPATELEDFYPAPLDLSLAFQIRPSEEGIILFFRDITSRRRSQAALQQQSDLLSTVQQAARVATWDVDLTTGAITFGAGSFPVFGRPFSELPDLQAFRRYIPREHLSEIDDLLNRTLATGEIIVTDFPVRSSHGALLWIEHRCRALIVDGIAVRLRGLSIDISDRKRSEEALAENEARYRILADLNPQAIWMGAPNGALTYGNQTLLDSYGFTEDDLTLRDWISVLDPRDRKRVREAWQRSLSTGEDLDVEARVLNTSGTHSRWAWLRAQPVRDDRGHILHWLGVNIDIHDRKTFTETLEQRQRETERQRAELETIYRTSPIGLALFDPVDFRYLRVNDRQAETIGLPADRILGRRITEIAPLDGIEEIFREVASGRSIRNHIFEGELPARPADHRFWNCNYSPVRNPEGKVEAIAAVVQEITHQKRSEQALIQSEKLAAVGRLASSISHEINNPLEAITNLFYLIQTSEGLPEEVANYVRSAQSELSRVCQIVTQTLRFHRQAVNATYVTAHELVGAVLDLYHGRLLNSGIEVQTDFRTTHPILCFENDIRQVLNNLIANAIDAMRQGGGRLLVRARQTTDRSPNHPPRRGTCITIADTGHGMPHAVKARLFEPFYTTKQLNGTGLGLWISAGIVSRHHGRLTLRSADHPLRHGTVFSLFLPSPETPPHQP